MENIFVEFLPPWVETGLQPAFYDKESGTVLQQTARMYARVNMLIRMFNKLSKQTKETVETYIESFNELHDYVHDYFDNLDVQEEINNKLDAMVEAGTLQEIIADYLNSKAVFGFETVSDMKSSTNLIEGSYARTLGYYQRADGGASLYLIRQITNDDVIDEMTIIEMLNDDSLIAELITEETMNAIQFGIKPSNTDVTTKFQTAINHCNTLVLEKGKYIISQPIILHQNSELQMEGGTIQTTNSHALFNFNASDEYLAYNGNGNITLENGVIIGGGISLIHAQDVTIKDIEFKNCLNDHWLEICGCKNVHIKGNTFHGCVSGTVTTFGAINIDACVQASFPWLDNGSDSYDGTTCENIYISHNNVDSTDGSIDTVKECKCIDAHVYDDINAHNNVFVNNNRLKGKGFTANILYKCNNVDFSNNIVTYNRYGVSIGGNYNSINNNQLLCPEPQAGVNGYPLWVGKNSESISFYNNAITHLAGSSTQKILLIDGNVTSYSFIKVDFIRDLTGQYASGTELSPSLDYTKMNSVTCGMGTGAHTQTFICTSYATRNFQSGDKLYIPQIDGNNVILEFRDNNKITYTNTDPNIASHPSYANLRWLSLGRDNIII